MSDSKTMALAAAGDDLDDGLVYDYDSDQLVHSLDEGAEALLEEEAFEKSRSSLGSSPSLSSSSSLAKNGSSKRKLALEDNDGSEAVSSLKKHKLKDSWKEKKRLRMEMDMQKKKQLSQETLPEAIADWVNQRIRQKNPDLSALELADMYLDKSVFRATGDFKQDRSLDNISDFLKAKFNNMFPTDKDKTNKKNKKKGSKNSRVNPESIPDTLEERKFICILSMSALRACDVHRSTRDLKGSSLKLINKNKLEVDLKLVGTTKSRVLCTSPGRLEKVLDAPGSGLKRNELKIVILDNTYLDQKMQNIWDITETLLVLKGLTDAGLKVYLY